MTIQRFENEDALAAALATRVLDAIFANPRLVLGLPTGRTPLRLYRELRERKARRWKLAGQCASEGGLVGRAHVQPR